MNKLLRNTKDGHGKVQTTKLKTKQTSSSPTKKGIFKDVNVINKFSTSSDHRIIRAHIKLQMQKELNKMISKTKPRNIKVISATLNKTITQKIKQALNKLRSTKSKLDKSSHNTKILIERRRTLRKNTSTDRQELIILNKEITKALRKDLRQNNA